MLPPRRSGFRRRAATVLGVVALVALVATTFRFVTDESSAEPGSASTPEAAPSPAVLPSSCASATEKVPQRAMRCDLVPFEEGRPTVVLWGDSHAWQLVPALEAAVADHDVNLVGFLFGSCPLVRAPGVNSECVRTNQMALGFVRKAARSGDPLRVVVSEAWELYHDVLDPADDGHALPVTDTIEGAAPLTVDGTPRLFDALAALDVPVDVVAPLPVVPTDVEGCAALEAGVPADCSLPRDAALEDESDNLEVIGELMAGLTDGELIDPSDSLCDDSECAAVVDGTPVFLDNIHLSAEISRELGSYFEPGVEELASA